MPDNNDGIANDVITCAWLMAYMTVVREGVERFVGKVERALAPWWSLAPSQQFGLPDRLIVPLGKVVVRAHFPVEDTRFDVYLGCRSDDQVLSRTSDASTVLPNIIRMSVDLFGAVAGIQQQDIETAIHKAVINHLTGTVRKSGMPTMDAITATPGFDIAESQAFFIRTLTSGTAVSPRPPYPVGKGHSDHADV